MKLITVDGVSWWKSSYSTAADCVALRDLQNGEFAMCNSRRPQAGVLIIKRESLRELIARIKSGAFDQLVV